MSAISCTGPWDLWDGVRADITARVGPALGKGPGVRQPVIEYLRDLEAIARRESADRQTIQVIASSRRLLGDPAEVRPGAARRDRAFYAGVPALDALVASEDLRP